MNQSRSVWNLSLAAFREATAANASGTPSCGATAAVTADLGLALVLMALRISEKKTPDPRRATLIDQAERLLVSLGRHADADIAAFERYMAAIRQSDQVPERTRGQALDATSRQATAVPLATAHGCIEALELAIDAHGLTADSVRSDVLAGGLLIHAALSAVLINVDVDLALLADAEERRKAEAARTSLQQRGDECLARLREANRGGRTAP